MVKPILSPAINCIQLTLSK